MTTQQVSRQWNMVLSRCMTELIPISSKQEHYAGDECWCMPNRIHLRHKSDPRLALRLWVHAADDVPTSKDLLEAIGGVLLYWDELQLL